jgi:hypothetical protein
VITCGTWLPVQCVDYSGRQSGTGQSGTWWIAASQRARRRNVGGTHDRSRRASERASDRVLRLHGTGWNRGRRRNADAAEQELDVSAGRCRGWHDRCSLLGRVSTQFLYRLSDWPWHCGVRRRRSRGNLNLGGVNIFGFGQADTVCGASRL